MASQGSVGPAELLKMNGKGTRLDLTCPGRPGLAGLSCSSVFVIALVVGPVVLSCLMSARVVVVVLGELVIAGLQQAPVSGSSLFGGLTWL